MLSISVLCHLYYPDSLPLLLPSLARLHPYQPRYYFNICSDTDYVHDLTQKIRSHFDGAIITASPNVGKDIGGKLVLIDTYLKLNRPTGLLLLLHDKISPHTSMGASWREKLLMILDEKRLNSILSDFEKGEQVGMIASQHLLMNEYAEKEKIYHCTSHQQLQQLRTTYGITTNHHEFVGGTMFWVRSGIYQSFFSTYSPLGIRATLEAGNVLDDRQGSYTHAWERMLSWIVLNQGFTIKGI